MPSFTSEQLNAGHIVGSFGAAGGAAKTLQFTNNSNKAGYFTLSQVTGVNEFGRIPEGTTDYTAGTFSSFALGLEEASLVKNKYKFSLIIPPGTPKVTFTVDDTTRTGKLQYKAEGDFSLSF